MRFSACLVASVLFVPGGTAAQVRPPAISRIAVFPLQHDQLPAQVGLILGERVAARVQEQNAGVSVLGPSGVLARLEAPDAQEAWNRFLFTFTMTGIADPVELERVCEGLGVDAVLDLELANWVQRDPTYAHGRRFLQALRVGLRGWLFTCAPPGLSWERWSEGGSVAIAPADTAAGTVTSPSASAAATAATERMLPLLPPLTQPSGP